MNTDHFKLPSHGKDLIIKRNDRTKECAGQILRLHDNASTMLLLVLAVIATSRGKAVIPCGQCVHDMVLMFRDMTTLIEELISDVSKSKPPK